MSTTTLIVVIAVLAIGTYSLRLAGVVLGARLTLSASLPLRPPGWPAKKDGSRFCAWL